MGVSVSLSASRSVLGCRRKGGDVCGREMMMVMMGSDCVMCVGWDFGKDEMMIFQCSALGFPLEFPSLRAFF